jgi:hypothetical protein
MPYRVVAAGLASELDEALVVPAEQAVVVLEDEYGGGPVRLVRAQWSRYNISHLCASAEGLVTRKLSTMVVPVGSDPAGTVTWPLTPKGQ